jgi:hypothetical protein
MKTMQAMVTANTNGDPLANTQANKSTNANVNTRTIGNVHATALVRMRTCFVGTHWHLQSAPNGTHNCG